MFQMTIPARDQESTPTVPYKDSQTITDAKWIENIATKRQAYARVKTPDKRVIQNLSLSFSKHRLGKQQRLLQDLSVRCRIQEVSDMSESITKKMNTEAKETHTLTTDTEQNDTTLTISTDEKLFDRTHTMFPPTKKLLRSTRRSGLSSSVSLPHLPTAGQDKKVYNLQLPPKKNLTFKDGKALQINGRVQIDHYLNDKQNMLSPLILPNVKKIKMLHGKDRIDSYVLTKKVNLYQKQLYAGIRDQWNVWSRHSERPQQNTRWSSRSQIVIPPTSQSARD